VALQLDERRRPLQNGVARTTDGGCSWRILWWSPTSERLGNIAFIDSTFGWMTSGQRLLESRTGGTRWQTVKPPRSDFYIESAYLVDRSRGWVIGSPAPGLYYTNDGGTHWSAVSDSDLRENRGVAREIPTGWGEGLLMKLQAGRAKQ
jgi:photosystem II stability/assembly factor-like uncharacterized protein